ncbi:MAG: hypothetical protein ABI812_09465 [Betaproteobacteria bacterium]
MAHILDPKHLASERDYCLALDELKQLSELEADTPVGWRFDEVASLIHEYESTLRLPLRPSVVTWPASSA